MKKYFTKKYGFIKNSISSPSFTTTLLLLVVIVLLFNLNPDAFRAGASPGPAIGVGTGGYISKWVTPSPFPSLQVGPINAQNVALLKTNSNLAWYNNLLHSSVATISNIISPTIYAALTPAAGQPLELKTTITNTGVATPAGKTFTNEYFIEMGKADCILDASKNCLPGGNVAPTPTVLTKTDSSWESSWDLNYKILSPGAGITTNGTFDGIWTIRANPKLSGVTGLPMGDNYIVFCSDVYGEVSDPSQSLSARCTPRGVSNKIDPGCDAGTVWDAASNKCVSTCPSGSGWDSVSGKCVTSVPGAWGSWNGAWSSCSKACGGGTQTQNRICSTPLYGGAECTRTNGTLTDPSNRVEYKSQSCNPDPCASGTGACGPHYSCTSGVNPAGSSTGGTNVSGTSKWTWVCNDTTTTNCQELKKKPLPVEN